MISSPEVQFQYLQSLVVLNRHTDVWYTCYCIYYCTELPAFHSKKENQVILVRNRFYVNLCDMALIQKQPPEVFCKKRCY